MRDGTHSLSWLDPAAIFFGLPTPLFGAISQIWFGIGGGSVYESGSARGEEKDEMAKWQRWERGEQRRSYKALPPPFRIRGFLGNRSTICASLNSPKRRGGPLPGLPRDYNPYRPFFAATCYCTPNIRRLLRNTIKAQ